MQEIISKELLSEVLGTGIVAIKEDCQFKNYVVINRNQTMNIHELAHKCKEYLLDEGYYLVVHPFKVELFEKETKDFIRDFHYPIQSKAIPYDIKRVIEACQWTLDNKDKDE